MSGRLASFQGPSTPSSTPAKQAKTPASPQRPAESTYHRKVRSLLQGIRAVAETWDDIVLVDGLKAAKSLIDARTDLDNELVLTPAGMQPKHRLVQSKLALMEKRIAELNAAIIKLRKQFKKMNSLVESLESLLYDAHRTKGWQFVQEPLWVTWSLEKFASSIPAILMPYHRSLEMHTELVQILRSHSVTFEVSRGAIAEWASQPYLEEGSWDTVWEDLCEAEIERWDSND